MTSTRSILLTSLAALVLAVTAGGCGKGDSPTTDASINAGDAQTATQGSGAVRRAPAVDLKSAWQPGAIVADNSSPEWVLPEAVAVAAPNLNPEVLIKTSAGDIRIRLDAEKSPQTVANFLDKYVRGGFYDGTIVHYVEEGSMIAGGGFDDRYQAKFARAAIQSEAQNGLKNKRGTIAMARDPADANSATSQWFINLVDNPSFDHKGTDSHEAFGYCVFGEVVEGMDVVDAIAKTPVHDKGEFVKTPVKPVVIQSVEELKP
jgi:cyclophilin family peptidyl-prolyl cis-trans isomerase